MPDVLSKCKSTAMLTAQPQRVEPRLMRVATRLKASHGHGEGIAAAESTHLFLINAHKEEEGCISPVHNFHVPVLREGALHRTEKVSSALASIMTSPLKHAMNAGST